MTAALTVLSIVVALLSLLVAGLLRSHAEILRRLHELGAGLETEGDPPGARPVAVASAPTTSMTRRQPGGAPGSAHGRPAADLSGTTLTGDPLVLRITEVEHDSVLLFLSSGCTTCEDFWDALRRPGGITLPREARLVVVTRNVDAESPAALERLAPAATVMIMSDDAWADYDVAGTPYVVHVDGRSGRVRGEGTAASWDQVARLLAQATGDPAYVARDEAGGRGRRPRQAVGQAARERAVDRELLAAGILPGDGSLYPPGGGPDAGANGHTS